MRGLVKLRKQIKENKGEAIFLILWSLGVLAFLISAWLSKDFPSKLNEWGDFIAGFVSPLGFFYLYRGFQQQQTALEVSLRSLVHQQAMREVEVKPYFKLSLLDQDSGPEISHAHAQAPRYGWSVSFFNQGPALQKIDIVSAHEKILVEMADENGELSNIDEDKEIRFFLYTLEAELPIGKVLTLKILDADGHRHEYESDIDKTMKDPHTYRLKTYKCREAI